MNVDIRLPKPHPNQVKILNSKAKYRVVLAGRQFGKSLLCLIVAIQRMLQGQRVAYVCPTFTPLGKEFFNQLLKYIPPALIKIDNKSELYVELITGGSIRFFSAEALNRFRGITKISLVIIDEAAHCPNLKEDFATCILPVLLACNGDLIAISTPAGRETFYSWYEKGLLEEDNNWESFHFTTYDNPKLEPDAIANLVANMTQAQIAQEIYAIAGANNLAAVDSDSIRNAIIPLSDDEPSVIGIDLGKYHDKTSVCSLTADGRMCKPFEYFNKPWELTKDIIVDVARRYPNVPIYVDKTGVGDSVVEALQLICNNINGFLFTQTTKPQIVYQMIKDIESGKLKINDVTANELYTFEHSYSSTGTIKFSARQGFFDDATMALCIANFYRAESEYYSDWKLYIR
jgi:Terminase large subunit, T4likevirus-type, N-terminal/Terminase RNaseH-like domain